MEERNVKTDQVFSKGVGEEIGEEDQKFLLNGWQVCR
jgi:hypothetical protein